jgi:PepSY-associated TM region
MRGVFLIHRYLGIGVGTLMVMWCLSGVVMMYVSYPELDETRRVRNLAPITWDNCCKISGDLLAENDSVDELQLEMLAGTPVLQQRSGNETRAIDLATGLAIHRVSAEQAAQVATVYANGSPPRRIGLIDFDQWTVSGDFDSDRPLHQFELADAIGTQIYVSSATGRAVQITTAGERFWNWLGSVPHWLYFAHLRRNGPLWGGVLIATSLIGCFLAATGIYIGVLQWMRRPAGRWTPYQGFKLWHHIAGLVFGVLALSWVSSGLLSMNPWGWLEGAGAQRERTLLRNGFGPSGRQIRAALQIFAAVRPPDLVSLKMAPFNGDIYFIATTRNGARRRLNVSALPAPLSEADWTYAAGILDGAANAPRPMLVTLEDAYYFSHHRDLAPLPVYRLIRPDGTRYYLDPVSGTLVAKVDRAARVYRWLHQGLHRMDFTAAMRGRPQWDVLMLALMSGVTLLCVTGTYLGYRRLSGRVR